MSTAQRSWQNYYEQSIFKLFIPFTNSLKLKKMIKLISSLVMILFSIIMITVTFNSCQKSNLDLTPSEASRAALSNAPTAATPNFNLEVILRGEGKSFGHVKFRQDNDAEKIVTLGIWVRDLQPNHEYKLQRAVDTNLDGICTSTTWLTLGKGLLPQSIFTDENGTGREELWRNLSAFPSGKTFDIHFRVIDAVNSAIVLASDCYQFTVR